MSAIDSVMKRLGFVKLDRYGLVLTPEGRIMSLRPAVLDDGLGGRIVGWQADDLAAMELQKWEPARPAPNAAAATRVAGSPPGPIVFPRATAPVPPPVTAPVPVPVPVVAMAVNAVVAPAPIAEAAGVAAGPQVEEDDWEWEIALARARVATEAAAPVARPMQTQAPRRRADTVPPPVTRPRPLQTVAAPAIAPIEDAWPKTEPLGTIDYEDYTNPATAVARIARVTPPVAVQRPVVAPVGVRKPTQPVPVVSAAAPEPPKPLPRASTSPDTVIPVPKLPSLETSTRTTQLQPVVRSMPTPIPPAAPRRFPKGTGPVAPTTSRMTVPSVRPVEELARASIAAASDQTKPGSALPPAARDVTLPSIKRLAR